MRGINKKPPAMCSAEFDRIFSQLSKAALIDALWCACQLGTDDTPEQFAAQAARSAVIALRERGDRVPLDLLSAAARPIDADAGEPYNP